MLNQVQKRYKQAIQFLLFGKAKNLQEMIDNVDHFYVKMCIVVLFVTTFSIWSYVSYLIIHNCYENTIILGRWIIGTIVIIIVSNQSIVSSLSKRRVLKKVLQSIQQEVDAYDANLCHEISQYGYLVNLSPNFPKNISHVLSLKMQKLFMQIDAERACIQHVKKLSCTSLQGVLNEYTCINVGTATFINSLQVIGQSLWQPVVFKSKSNSVCLGGRLFREWIDMCWKLQEAIYSFETLFATIELTNCRFFSEGLVYNASAVLHDTRDMLDRLMQKHNELDTLSEEEKDAACEQCKILMALMPIFHEECAVLKSRNRDSMQG